MPFRSFLAWKMRNQRQIGTKTIFPEKLIAALNSTPSSWSRTRIPTNLSNFQFWPKICIFSANFHFFHQKCPFFGHFGPDSLIIHDCDHSVIKRSLIIHEFISYSWIFHQSFINFWAQEPVPTRAASILVFARSIWRKWQTSLNLLQYFVHHTLVLLLSYQAFVASESSPSF